MITIASIFGIELILAIGIRAYVFIPITFSTVNQTMNTTTNTSTNATKLDEPQQFDAIVIGSGIGGLTVAALLTKIYRKKVLVLEQHFTPGGFTHGFKRKGRFYWDVGVHYVGSMGKDSFWRKVFDYLSDGNLQWQKLPEPFEKFVYPDFTFEVYGDSKRYQADLIEKFPAEAKAIRRYFKDIRAAGIWLILHNFIEVFPSFLRPLMRFISKSFGAIARQTTEQYLDRHFQDPQLKGLLVSQWGDYGLPPEKSSFGLHGAVANHYLQGGWYPVGGAQVISTTIIPALISGGSKVITQRRVTEILIENDRAVGVKVQNVARPNAEIEVYRAPIVVSNAGVINTFLKLIPPNYPLPHREEIATFRPGWSVVSLYIGLKDGANPQKVGFHGENHWIFTSYNHTAMAASPLPTEEPHPQLLYLSFPSLKDPSLTTAHSVEILTAGDYDLLSQWQNTSWKRRGPEYQEMKAKVAAALIDLVESRYPGFKDLIEYTELSTPLTIEHFASSHRGDAYGIPVVPERFDFRWTSSRTPIKNLYLTGADTLCPGLVVAMLGGIKTVGILGGHFGFLKIMATILLGKK